MAKKEKKDKKVKIPELPGAPEIPKEALEKVEKMKKKLDDFKEKVLEKFEDYILGIALLKPNPEKKEQINVLILVDDSDTKKMTKEELKRKLSEIFQNIAKDIDKNISPEVMLLTSLWEELYDGHYEILKEFVISAPIYDKGMLSALKIAELHKRMVLEKFEKYIVAYVLGGSLVQGKATPKSDIDVFIVVDDTDVKRMTRAELKDKLRAIIIGMGFEAGKITGIENKLNIQVYILTDFWENIKEANPIIFTFLRDGVPLYDRGIFMPWKQLLRMGRIKPSRESIEMYKESGEQMLKRVKLKLKEIAVEDFFWSILTPTQAAIMLYGLPPPTPKETPQVVRDIFIKKEKMLEEEYVKILEKVITTRKKIEHDELKDIKGRDIDELLRDSEKYLNRLKKLFKDIEEKKEKERLLAVYDSVMMVARDALLLEGEETVSEKEILKKFKEKIIHKNYLPERYYRILEEVIKARKDYEKGTLTKVEVEEVMKKSREFLSHVIEHIERKKAKELEESKIIIKHGDRIGEVIFTDEKVFIIHDTREEEKEITKADLTKEGTLGRIEESNLEELEKAIRDIKVSKRPLLKPKLVEQLKEIFGEDLEIVMH